MSPPSSPDLGAGMSWSTLRRRRGSWSIPIGSGPAPAASRPFSVRAVTAVYVASIITGLVGGYVVEHFAPQAVFMLNAAFPLVILCVALLWIQEKKITTTPHSPPWKGGEVEQRLAIVKKKFTEKQTWLLAFFIFFAAFSPSFGTPFFYYSVDTLKFTPVFLGIVASIAAGAAAVGAILFGKLSVRFSTRRILKIF